jgi:serine/threonine-protein kinase
VAGKYRLTRLLGRGGMGTVWEGVHESLGTRVAVKLIELEHVQSPDSLRRFENEAHAAARLQSKHIVEVYDHGVMADGRAFIVMQYLQGESLERRLERLGRMAPVETARIVLQICRGLTKAHAIGIVHRDLKPENIFLVWDEEDGADIVKVVDFGIAKFTERTPVSDAAGTYTGSLLGTPFYMSPEQARGLRTVDHRSDIWSVGVITYRCMLGKLPFEGESVGDVLVKLCTGPIPVPSEVTPDLPAGFDAFISRALSRDLAVRFSSAAELAEGLAQVCGLPLRPAYATGDIPIRNSDAGNPSSGSPNPVITPSYPNQPFPPDPTLPSRIAPHAGPEVSIGGGVTNTSPRPPRRSKASVVLTFAFGLVALGVSTVALMRSRPPATGAAVDESPPPAPTPSATVAPSEPFPSVFAPPPAATASAPVEADRPAPAAASASAAPSALPRPPIKNPKRPPAAASSNRAPNLDIRLER